MRRAVAALILGALCAAALAFFVWAAFRLWNREGPWAVLALLLGPPAGVGAVLLIGWCFEALEDDRP